MSRRPGLMNTGVYLIQTAFGLTGVVLGGLLAGALTLYWFSIWQALRIYSSLARPGSAH